MLKRHLQIWHSRIDFCNTVKISACAAVISILKFNLSKKILANAEHTKEHKLRCQREAYMLITDRRFVGPLGTEAVSQMLNFLHVDLN